MSGIGAAVLAAALAVTAVSAWWLRGNDGRLRSPRAEEGNVQEGYVSVADRVSVSDRVTAFDRLGVRAADADLTVVQFSTAFCGPCRATKARLAQLQATRPGLAVVQVDAESHLDEVRALDVRRTPTLFYLDRGGRLVGRSSGAPRPDELTALVDAHVVRRAVGSR